jgi:hypothetical protein
MATASTPTATRCCSYELVAQAGKARLGRLHLPHGVVPTPAFMPVGTAGSVKGLTPDEVWDIGASMILANTFHLWVRPGADLVQRLGGPAQDDGLDGADPHRLRRLSGVLVP